ncbi:hypothetical protein C8F01DRAFT_1378023, partial [Mycena amicta]
GPISPALSCCWSTRSLYLPPRPSKARSGSPTPHLSPPLVLLSHAFPSDRRGATTSAHRYRALREISAERQATRNQSSTLWILCSPPPRLLSAQPSPASSAQVLRDHRQCCTSCSLCRPHSRPSRLPLPPCRSPPLRHHHIPIPITHCGVLIAATVFLGGCSLHEVGVV